MTSFANPSGSFPDMPCMKGVYRDKKVSVHWSAARNEECFLFRGHNAKKPRSTDHVVPPFVPRHALHEEVYKDE